MNFSAWYTAAEIGQAAPALAGVFQVRAQALLEYPKGKSAMVYYGVATDLCAEMQTWESGASDEDLLYRHASELGKLNPAEALERLLRRFSARFGCAPTSSP